MCSRIMNSAKSYDEALIILQDYVEIVDKESIKEEEF